MDAMDAVLRNFKTIPCPAGDSCAKPTCPWQHTWDIHPPHAQAQDRSQDEDGPRKRRKVSSEPAPVPTPLPSRREPEPLSAKRSVSPPPLKRKLPQPTAGLTPTATPAKPPPQQPQRAGASSTPASKPRQTVTPQKATPHPQTTPQKTKATPTPRKPETLNPRHLKSAAPAAHDFRHKALKMLHDQFQRLDNELKKDAKRDEEALLLSPQELIWLALDEEQRMATDRPAIYNNVIKNRIMTYKRMTPGQWRDERAAELKKQEAATTPATKTPSKSVLGPPKEIHTGLTPQQEVDFLTHLYTPIAGLSQWGYVPTPPSDQEIAKAREGDTASLGWEVCDRCLSRFQVFPGRREEDGALASGGKCVHHPGRAYFPERTPGVLDRPAKRYRCCQQVVGESSGCATADTHVFKTASPARLAAVVPFAETPPNPRAPTDRAVCFDCEMGYTTRGMELIRLTATSWPDGAELLDVLVQPVGEILDLNSRYSGVWPEDMLHAEPWSAEEVGSASTQTRNIDPPIVNDAPKHPPATTATSSPQETSTPKKKLRIVPSPTAARDLLFSLIAPTTPLIGHGLENDLNAVRVVHPTLVDTILLFPHRRGLPMRHGLRMLMETRLNKAIQVEAVDERGRAVGHDSAEDARAAGELVRLRVMELWRDMRAQGWILGGDGGFVPPGAGGGGGAGEGGGVALSERFLEEAAG